MAGIAAGNGAAAGVPFSGVTRGAELMSVQVFSRLDDPADCIGSPPCVQAWDSDLIAGLERVYALRAVHSFASVNLSVGGGLTAAACDGEPIKAIIDNLRSVGIATVVAAGNGGSTNGMAFPACVSSTVSVASTTKADVVSSLSNISPLTSLLAPARGSTG